MRELFLSEWERVWARKKTKMTLGLFAAVTVLLALWLRNFGVGFENADLPVRLTAWNFAPFLLKEGSFFLMLVVAPMLFVDSLAGERAQGAYRMVLLRPQGRGALLVAKWGALAAVMAVFLTVVLAVGVLFGAVFLKAGGALAEQASTVSAVGSWAQVGLYFLLFDLIVIAALGVCSLICSVMTNTVLAYAAMVGSFVGMLYVSEHLRFFLLGGETLFRVLSGTGVAAFAGAVALVIAVSYGGAWVVWQKRDLC